MTYIQYIIIYIVTAYKNSKCLHTQKTIFQWQARYQFTLLSLNNIYFQQKNFFNNNFQEYIWFRFRFNMLCNLQQNKGHVFLLYVPNRSFRGWNTPSKVSQVPCKTQNVFWSDLMLITHVKQYWERRMYFSVYISCCEHNMANGLCDRGRWGRLRQWNETFQCRLSVNLRFYTGDKAHSPFFHLLPNFATFPSVRVKIVIG